MGRSRTDFVVELLASGTGPLSDEEVAGAAGVSAGYVRRLREDEGFVAEVNRRAKRRFLSRLPEVLSAVASGAVCGGNATAMKLFLDACRCFEGGLVGNDGEGELREAEELLERVREMGVPGGSAKCQVPSAEG